MALMHAFMLGIHIQQCGHVFSFYLRSWVCLFKNLLFHITVINPPRDAVYLSEKNDLIVQAPKEESQVSCNKAF